MKSNIPVFAESKHTHTRILPSLGRSNLFLIARIDDGTSDPTVRDFHSEERT